MSEIEIQGEEQTRSAIVEKIKEGELPQGYKLKRAVQLAQCKRQEKIQIEKKNLEINKPFKAVVRELQCNLQTQEDLVEEVFHRYEALLETLEQEVKKNVEAETKIQQLTNKLKKATFLVRQGQVKNQNLKDVSEDFFPAFPCTCDIGVQADGDDQDLSSTSSIENSEDSVEISPLS